MTAVAMPTSAGFRARFPILDDVVHLASCSLGPRSAALDEAMARMLDVLREDPTPWDFWLGQVLQARDAFAALINAEPAQVAVVPSATIGAYQVASTRDWSTRPGIVAADVEYPSVAHIWAAQQARGATLRYVPETGPFDADERTGLVSVPLVSYRTGATLPVGDVVARARAAGALTFVDAYQAVGVLPVDVAALGCDFLVSGTMKYLLGLPGIAFLYARDGVADDLDPQLTGFFGRTNPLAFDPFAVDYPPDARRYQVTMPTLPAALAANAGLGLIGGLDLAAVERHVTALARRAAERIEGVAAPTGPYVNVPDADPMGLARFLNARRIFPARGRSVRLSFHYFNSEADVDAAAAAIAEWRRR
ncbi:aminotransferase class V-fold PLP-dependent enzyme [Micromonospora sp. DT31]|uniref:aminotransferase class V-fold PLP-dependent enzyme n=1 Tax=Micromonospora sp. DT31 TaxID=3393434 RepID=UPI003CE6BB69